MLDLSGIGEGSLKEFVNYLAVDDFTDHKTHTIGVWNIYPFHTKMIISGKLRASIMQTMATVYSASKEITDFFSKACAIRPGCDNLANKQTAKLIISNIIKVLIEISASQGNTPSHPKQSLETVPSLVVELWLALMSLFPSR